MAGEVLVTIIGNLTADPELRFTPSGAAVATFTVVSSPRTYDRVKGEFREGDPLFMRCTIWNAAAENAADSLSKGMRVIVRGRLYQRSYETREGERRVVVELRADEIGPSLKYATAQVTRSTRSSSSFTSQDNFSSAPATQSQDTSQSDDPWGVSETSGVASFGEEPPF